MGLVYCPKCGEEISDKAISCPHCNFAFSKQNIVKCEECGMEYNCGEGLLAFFGMYVFD